ncbi:MAG: class I SAM-dependent methyltransferase [Pseudomonadota bacterium]
MIQCAAFGLALAAAVLLARAAYAPSLLALALLQGTAAALLTWWRALAPWWCAIGLLFPVCVFGASALALPPSLFLAGFLLLLGVYWSAFRTQVPFYPSGRVVWDAVLAQLPPHLPPGRPLKVLDIGSGMGGLVLHLARARPDAQVTGIELAPLPFAVSWLRARLGASPARFVRGDYENADFGACDVVFAYLSPAAMDRLWHKAVAEMRPGAILLSYEFVIAGRAPDLSIVVAGSGTILYLWHF